MSFLHIRGLIILVTITYKVTGLRDGEYNQYMESGNSNEDHSINCRHLYEDLHGDMVDVDKEPPGEKYYKLVIKVDEAFQSGLLVRIQGSWNSEASGKYTEQYILIDCYTELRLPSIVEYHDARLFFQNNKRYEKPQIPISNKIEKVDRITEDAVAPQPSDSSKSVHSNSFKNDPIREMEVDMLAIPLDSVPGIKYYTLVLKVDEAIRQRLISAVKDSFHNGENGVATNLYIVRETNEQLILPSIRELRNAKFYLDKLKKEELKTRTGEGKVAQVKPVNSESQNRFSESASSSSTVLDYKVNKNGAQGREQELDDQKILQINRLILQQQRESRRHGGS